jgi:CheY-like chemotaxis protein
VRKQRARRVLLIDDDEQIRRVYERFFTAAHYEIQTASGGTGALEIARRWKPDVVLLDLMMPDVRGSELIVLLKVQPATRDALFVAFSGSLIEQDRERMKSAGFDDVIPKGQETSEVIARVGELLTVRLKA